MDTGHDSIAAIEKLLLSTSEGTTITELEAMVRQQNGSTDKLIETCTGIAGLPINDTTPATEAALVTICLPATTQPYLECSYNGVVRNAAEYQDLAYRATLHQELCPALNVFTSQVREVLRAFNAACRIHSEGHLEFRSRKLPFRHNNAGPVTAILHGLQGQWSGSGNGGNVYEAACKKHQELACLSPAELVRLAELARSVTATGELSANEAAVYMKRWRAGRAVPMHRGADCSHMLVEDMYPKIDPRPTLIESCVLPDTTQVTPAEGPGGDVVLNVAGVGDADGEYRQGHWMYQRLEDTAVLCPVNRGWNVYEKPEYQSKVLLSSAHVVGWGTGRQPWEVGDWREASPSGVLQLPANLSVSVTMDDGHTTLSGWSQESKTRDETIVVSGVRDLDMLGLSIVNKSALYITEVVQYSAWESMGLEPGMRVIGVNGERGDAKSLLELMNKTIQHNGFLAVTVVPAWVWTQTSRDIKVSPNGRGVRKLGTTTAPAIATCPASGEKWRVKFSGDTFGMRVGLATYTNLVQDPAGCNEKVWWLTRNGTLRHKGKVVAMTSSFRSGDILTVHHDRQSRTIEFSLNGHPLSEAFHDVADQPLHPVVYLLKKSAAVELSPGAPIEGVERWNPERKSDLIELLDDGMTAHRKVTHTGTYGAVVGDTVFRGPGPHAFELKVMGRDITDCSFGVAPPGVFLHKQYDKVANFFGLTIRPDGNIFGLKENKILLSLTKKSFSQGDRITFISDLGVGSLEILCNGDRVVHSSEIDDLPKVKGPLVPYCILGNQDVKCTLLKVSSQSIQRRTHGPPSVVIKNCTPRVHGHQTPTADGVYSRYLPTYTRTDGLYHIFHWDSRWCIADRTDKPIAWSNDCNGSVPLGSKALRWTVVRNYTNLPPCLRLVVPGVCRVLLKLTDTKNILYESSRGNEGFRLSWKPTISRWVISSKRVPESRKTALYIGLDPVPLPHHCVSWAWGGESMWHPDGRISLLPCDEPLKYDAEGVYWTKSEYGKGWSNFTSESKVHDPPGKPICFLGVDIKMATTAGWGCGTCQVVNTPGLEECSSCGSPRPASFENPAVFNELESMTSQELAGWHIVHNVTRVRTRAPNLRLSLQEAAGGMASGLELLLPSDGAEAAIQDVRKNAELQLERLGVLLRGLATKDAAGGTPALNFDPTTGKYGRMQAKTIEGNTVDVSRLPVVDRRVFGLALFTAIEPYHVLDCTPATPHEEVLAFLVRYSLLRGRFVLFNLQVLSSDLQNRVRTAAAENHADRQLIALVTAQSGHDETIDFVTTQECDPRWRIDAHAKIVALRKFESITYFNQPSGSGKSYAIEQLQNKNKYPGIRNPVRLDLDSTTDPFMETVCTQLMCPLRATKGLLIVNVGHDTYHKVVNTVLDGLCILGRVSSASGLVVSTPLAGWHLIVEFQEPPSELVGKPGGVEGTWRAADGATDITLLACRGLATQGDLVPFNLQEVDGSEDSLAFMRSVLGYLPAESDELAVRMLATGVTSIPGEDDPRHADIYRELQQVTPVRMTRVMRFISARFKSFSTCKSVDEVELRKLVAVSLQHEAFHLVSPGSADHFHLRTTDNIRTNRIQLSGETPQEIREAIDAYLTAHVSKVVSKPVTDRIIDPLRKPLHILVKILSEELDVKVKSCAQTLLTKGYVLTPDFLQKLVQLATHVSLKDPIILQGPSGTGKSYAVEVLSALMQIPSPRSARKGYKDLLYSLYLFLRRDSALKKLFPNNVSDQVGTREKALWIAECRFGYDKCVDCLTALRDAKNLPALSLVATAVKDSIGPLINDSRANPEFAELIDNSAEFRRAVDTVIHGVSMYYNVTDIYTSLVCLIKDISMQSSGMLTTHIIQCVEASLRSLEMEDFVGSGYKTLISTLDKNHLRDAMTEWAKDAVTRAGSNGAALISHVREHMRSELAASPILRPKPEFLRALAEGPSSHEPNGAELAALMSEYLDIQREETSCNVLIRYDMTPAMLFNALRGTFERALACPEIPFVVMIDEMNATNMLGLIKRIVIDRRWQLWEDLHPSTNGWLPPNIAFVGAVNPSKKDPTLEGIDPSESTSDLGFDVTPMSPSLMEHVVPWKQLAEDQRELFISRLIGANKNLFRHQVSSGKVSTLSRLLLKAHHFVQRKCAGKRSTVSQRDIHRAMKLFDFFFKRGDDFIHAKGGPAVTVWDRALTAMMLGVAVSYYFRLGPEERSDFSTHVTGYLTGHEVDPAQMLPRGVTFAGVVQRAARYYCGPHLILPEAVYAHAGLIENLFVQIVAFDSRLAVILHGPPGTSKTLSNNIIRDNMTGRGEFWNSLASIAEVCRYQGSAQSSADEIQRKCEEAVLGQKNHDAHGHSNKRSLLFVDEAGLVKSEGLQRKWALKVLHYYLEGANIASVLMTNQPLDPAITNRCIEVYMAKPRTDELSSMCAGILHNEGMQGLTATARTVTPLCCTAFHELLGGEGDKGKERYRWWFGLRDLFHMMRYIRRNQHQIAQGGAGPAVDITPRLVTEALERNFNAEPGMFNEVVQTFGRVLGEVDQRFSAVGLRQYLRRKLDVITDSIADNNRVSERSATKNLNDMMVRYKLLVDETDGCILHLLRQTGIEFANNASVLSLSALCDQDDLMPVTVVSQISAAMETGRTVWLTNTREVDACLFDVFNQNYIVASNGKGEVLHFVAVAVGGTLEYKRVHKDFQCIVHVTKEEAAGMGDTLPSPFLNRLEKYTLSVSEVLDYAVNRLSEPEKALVAKMRAKLTLFDRTLSTDDSIIFTDNTPDTASSLLLEAVQSGSLQPLPITKRLQADESLASFLYPADKSTALWRSLSCKALQLMKPGGMILAQKVLVNTAPAYLRAYFNNLNPWDLSGYLGFLRDLMLELGHAQVWYRVVVYMPANVDLPLLLKGVGGCVACSVDTLMESERGHEDLREAVYRFCADDSLSVLVVVLPPSSISKPEFREIQLLLENPPDLKDTIRTSKAVILIQATPTTTPTGCVPLFGTGWGQLYIDAAGEHLGSNLRKYVDSSVVDYPELPTEQPEWAQIERLTEQAVICLMQAQAEHQIKWSQVDPEDPAYVLYDPKCLFEEQVKAAKELLGVCPKVKSVLCGLCRECLPREEELVVMGKEVAAQKGAVASLAQRLLDGEQKAHCALLTTALHILLNDRNASALLQCNPSLLRSSDDMLAMAIQVTTSPTNFEKLRNFTTKNYPPLTVRAVPPTLPGSSALRRVLPISTHAIDAMAEMRKLQTEHEGGLVGKMVDIIHQDQALLVCFFTDAIRAAVKHGSSLYASRSLNGYCPSRSPYTTPSSRRTPRSGRSAHCAPLNTASSRIT
eukprot:TRINITY_DN620_c0_g2_i3.p1 TRINITY_DN620_c0_g2~~TRINITY_DN620_c0_g2_i3.p1  ORF type:complete len:3310 (+),score=504.39 TRINITY_DN620_c0_g2_i3:3263-13192(+)